MTYFNVLTHIVLKCHTVQFLTSYNDRIPPDDGQMLDPNILWQNVSVI
jgi:hypothetical protein